MNDVLNTKAIHAADQYPWPREEDQPIPDCFGHDPQLWQPETVEDYEKAVTICNGCPQRSLCREVAEVRGEYGIWGGVLYVNGKPLDAMPVPGRPKQGQPAAA